MFIRPPQFSSSAMLSPAPKAIAVNASSHVNVSPATDQFVKSAKPVDAEAVPSASDTLFNRLGLHVSMAEPNDLPEIADLMLEMKKRGEGLSPQDQFIWLSKHADYFFTAPANEIEALLVSATLTNKDNKNMKMGDFTVETFQHLLKSLNEQKVTMCSEAGRKNLVKIINDSLKKSDSLPDDAKKEYLMADYKNRFMSTPRSVMVLLRDKNNKIIGTIGINPFQKMHDLSSFGITDALDEKHGLITALYVVPHYRNKGVATALKKKMIQIAHDVYKYKYLHAPTETHKSSHRINLKLGYKPWTPEARFADTPSITSEVVKELIDNYNIGPCQLCWIDTSTVK